jgi:hypothetical protein
MQKHPIFRILDHAADKIEWVESITSDNLHFFTYENLTISDIGGFEGLDMSMVHHVYFDDESSAQFGEGKHMVFSGTWVKVVFNKTMTEKQLETVMATLDLDEY